MAMKSSPPALVFAGALLFAALAFGSSIVLLTRGSAVEAEPTRTSAPAATVARTATPAPSPVRVASATGTAERLDSGAYRITFVWMLEGARDGDTAVVRFFAGTRQLQESRGPLDPNVYSASTGRLTLVTSQECSAEGWTAELVMLRGQAPIGNAVARIAGVTCR